jgi:hypothetical protein
VVPQDDREQPHQLDLVGQRGGRDQRHGELTLDSAGSRLTELARAACSVSIRLFAMGPMEWRMASYDLELNFTAIDSAPSLPPLPRERVGGMARESMAGQ